MTRKTPPIKSIQRAVSIVYALWDLREAGPSELANYLDLSKSTAYVYLRSLESEGFVINHEGKYQLSYKFLTIGSRVKYRNRLFQVSRSEMRNLALETGELVTLVIEQDAKSVILHQEQGNQALELGMYPGMTIPLHSQAAGKVSLANMDENRVNAIINRDGLKQMTEKTITDRETLVKELQNVRDNGYSVDWDQQVKGLGVIAVPIIVEELKGVLAIACPTGRIMNESYRDELLQRLQGTTDTLTVKYRYGT